MSLKNRIRVAGMICGAAVALTGISSAQAVITLQVSVVPWNLSNSNAAVMNANGWEALELTLVADGKSVGVDAWDFKNPVTGFTDKNHDPLAIPVGISGPIHQAWSVASDGTISPTPLAPNTANAGGVPQSSAATSQVDSFWANYPANYNFITFDPRLEDNNVSDSPLSSIAPSSVLDTPGIDYGVGSSMTESGSFFAVRNPGAAGYDTTIHAVPTTVDLAFLVVPKNLSGGDDVHVFGYVGDSQGGGFVINQIVNPAIPGASGTSPDSQTAPEPASVGLMAGLAAVLLRRGKN